MSPLNWGISCASTRRLARAEASARACPAGCIRVLDGAAVRDALGGQGCNACLACIHACPNGAISLPMGEANPQARFRNSHVTLARIMQANEMDE